MTRPTWAAPGSTKVRFYHSFGAAAATLFESQCIAFIISEPRWSFSTLRALLAVGMSDALYPRLEKAKY
jgi:hypothetical protein